jgi:hypothetical protein
MTDPLPHIQQTNRSSGCGPACVAMLARSTEEEAIEAIFGEPRTRSLGTEWYELKQGLEALGVCFASRAKRVTDLSRISSVAIIGCSKRTDKRGAPQWHWIVFDGRAQRIHDPLQATPILLSEFRRKPFSYLTVIPKRRLRETRARRAAR